MEKKWNEMNASEKRWVVVLFICAAIMLVFCVLDLTGKWKNPVYLYMTSVYFLIEGVRGFKKNRKTGLLDLALCIVFLVNAIL